MRGTRPPWRPPPPRGRASAGAAGPGPAPPGVVLSPLVTSSRKRYPSVPIRPVGRPAASRIAASSAATVDLPLVPVTAARISSRSGWWWTRGRQRPREGRGNGLQPRADGAAGRRPDDTNPRAADPDRPARPPRRVARRRRRSGAVVVRPGRRHEQVPGLDPPRVDPHAGDLRIGRLLGRLDRPHGNPSISSRETHHQPPGLSAGGAARRIGAVPRATRVRRRADQGRHGSGATPR